MKSFFLFIFATNFIPLLAFGGIWGYDGQRNNHTRYVWEYKLGEFSQERYSSGIEALFRSFEKKTGKRLTPGEKRRAGIKIYTNSGSGIATPPALVKAVLSALKRRGFANDELFLLDLNESLLRSSGFLPPLSRRAKGNFFEDVPVYILDSKDFFDPIWYYDSSLPRYQGNLFSEGLDPNLEYLGRNDENRKSFLPKILLTEVDFWINIPMALDHPAVGLAGGIVNASLWNMSNRDRFFSSPANAPIAASEVAAIPELTSSLAITILPLERYQFIGGPIFNSLYTRSEDLLWMSVNPVVLDALILSRLNKYRREEGFRPIGNRLPILVFAEKLGLGSADTSKINWIRLR